jgi:hypothetical protein
MSHLDFVRTPWGGYYVDPMQIEKARREGQRWAEAAITKIRDSLKRPRRQKRVRRQRPPL